MKRQGYKMSKGVFCYQHHIEKYDSDTVGLTLIQHGAYRRLMDFYFKTRARLTSDINRLYSITGCSCRAEKEAVSYVVNRFFTVGEDGFLRQKGAENELVRITKVSEENRRKANIKHLKLKETTSAAACAAAVPEGVPNGCQPSTINHIDEAKASSPPPPIDDLISAETNDNVKKIETTEPAKKENKRVRKPLSYITDDFQADFADIALAGELGVDVEKARNEFVDYWKGCGKPMSDWNAAFRNRLRTIAQYRKEREQRALTQRPDVRDVTGSALRAAEALRQKRYGS